MLEIKLHRKIDNVIPHDDGRERQSAFMTSMNAWLSEASEWLVENKRKCYRFAE